MPSPEEIKKEDLQWELAYHAWSGEVEDERYCDGDCNHDPSCCEECPNANS